MTDRDGAAPPDLAAAMDGARMRTHEDGTDPEVPVAGTALLLDDGADGPEVLMLERPDRGSFAGAWVFPGGKVEDGDEGGGEEDVARAAAARETWEETGLVVATGALRTLSCWDPPPGLALRIRTWFFLAERPTGALALAADEAVDAAWVRPADVLARHARGELTLYPPTWVTLHGLARQPDVTAVFDAARLSGVERFETVTRPGRAGPMLLWNGDAEYGLGDPPEAASARHRLEVGARPWLYTRTDA
ncbi:MAG: NUDIX domain-containing protein [Microbacterium sp.]|uniref:NUDIX domain-containing protein n=1 Tax=Microbacterium sp. TaxID=51671 RepID=UPI003A844CEC